MPNVQEEVHLRRAGEWGGFARIDSAKYDIRSRLRSGWTPCLQQRGGHVSSQCYADGFPYLGQKITLRANLA